MDPSDQNELRIHRVEIVTRLEPGDVINNLYEDGIMSEGELTQLSTISGTPQKERCRILLGKLPSRGPKALLSFVSALIENGYSDLANKINLNDERGFPTRKRNGSEPCDNCAPFIPKTNGNSGLMYLLKKECCLLFDLDPLDFLDFYYQENLFDENTCEIVQAGITRLDRCKLFYDMLCRFPLDKVISVFKMALRSQVKYKFIYDALQEDFRLLLDSSTESCQSSHTGIFSKNAIGYNQPPFKGINVFDRKQKYEDNDVQYFEDQASWGNPSVKRQIHLDESISRRRTRLKRSKRNNKYLVDSVYKFQDAILLDPSSLPIDIKINKHRREIYDNLNALIYNCQFQTFDERLSLHLVKYKEDPDMACMLTYVQANKLMYVFDYNGAMQHIQQGLHLLQTTNVSDSSQIQVELLAAAARIHVGQNNVSAFRNTLDDAKMIVKSDPNRCKGLSAGKLSFVEARSILAEMASLSLDKDKTKLVEYISLRNKAMESLRLALLNDREIYGEVGLFSRSLVHCVMVIVLLCCGENGSTMNVLEPTNEDITQAGDLLFQVENSDDPVPDVLQIALLKAKCDYFFRRNNFKKAEECVIKALSMEEEKNLAEFAEHSRVRLKRIREKNDSGDQQKLLLRNNSEVDYIDTSYFADVSDTEDKSDTNG